MAPLLRRLAQAQYRRPGQGGVVPAHARRPRHTRASTWAGRSSRTVTHTRSMSTPSYIWITRFRIPIIISQGFSGCASFISSDTRRAASQMSRTHAGSRCIDHLRRIQDFAAADRIPAGLDPTPADDIVAAPGASSTRSRAGRYLHPSLRPIPDSTRAYGPLGRCFAQAARGADAFRRATESPPHFPCWRCGRANARGVGASRSRQLGTARHPRSGCIPESDVFAAPILCRRCGRANARGVGASRSATCEPRGYWRASSTARVRAKRTRGARITCLSMIARRSRGGTPPTREDCAAALRPHPSCPSW